MTGPSIKLELEDGSFIDLGSPDDVAAAASEIVDSTGGSSGGGAWSALWGLLSALATGGNVNPLEHWYAPKVAQEAEDYERRAGDLIGDNARALLAALKGLDDGPGSDGS